MVVGQCQRMCTMACDMPAPGESWPLAQLQARMAAALWAADDAAQQLPESLFAGALPGADGLRVHRNTALGALSNALRLTYPAIDRLVGEAFFDRMAVDFARAHPPAAPQLSAWGSGFGAFIAGFPGTESLGYLSELARFEAQFDVLARCAPDEQFSGARLPLGPSEGPQAPGAPIALRFDATLRVHVSPFAVLELRDAILAEDLGALAAMTAGRALAAGEPAPRDADASRFHYALWRSGQGVMVRSLSAASAHFLQAALGGVATGHVADAESVAVLQREVLQAAFVRLETRATN